MFAHALVKALLFIAGIWWCREVIARWRDDVRELRETDDAGRRTAVIVIWIVTLAIAAVCAWFAVGLIGHLLTFLRGL